MCMMLSLVFVTPGTQRGFARSVPPYHVVCWPLHFCEANCNDQKCTQKIVNIYFMKVSSLLNCATCLQKQTLQVD